MIYQSNKNNYFLFSGFKIIKINMVNKISFKKEMVKRKNVYLIFMIYSIMEIKAYEKFDKTIESNKLKEYYSLNFFEKKNVIT